MKKKESSKSSKQILIQTPQMHNIIGMLWSELLFLLNYNNFWLMNLIW